MRRALILTFWCITVGARAGAATRAAARPGGEFLPGALRTRALLAAMSSPTPRTSELDALLQGTGAPSGAAPQEAALSQHKRYVLPVLLSVAVPGAGEIYTGHWARGLPLVAADVATWIAFGHFQQEGRDWRFKYETFADQHWSYSRWQDSLQVTTYYDSLDAFDHCVCAWIPKEQDRQHYYENIGKYRYYWMGWDDWKYTDPANSDSQAHRRQYDDMRIQSNDNFDRSTNMILVGMATRLVSVVETVFLVRGDLRREGGFEVRPLRTSGRGTGVELAYRY